MFGGRGMIPRKNFVSILLATIMIVSTLSVGTPSIVEASSSKIFYVGGSGPGNYTTIQDAIDNASEGNTVFVYEGVYLEHLRVKKPINLIGENRDTTIIDGGGRGYVVRIYANHTNVSGFNITLGDLSYPYAGIAIYSDYNTIFGNTIIGNHYGLWINGSFNNIANNNISLNDARGIRMLSSYGNIIQNNTFYKNEHHSIQIAHSVNTQILNNKLLSGGKGITLTDDSNHCTIFGNSIKKHGVGIFVSKCNDTLILDNILDSNSNMAARSGIGIIIGRSSNTTIIHNVISKSYSGICIRSSSKNNIVQNNSILSSGNSAIIINENSCNNIISNNYMWKNGNYSGKRPILNVIISISNCHNNTFIDNTIIQNTGTVILCENSCSIQIRRNIMDYDSLKYSLCGIKLVSSHKISIHDNTITQATDGIFLQTSYDNNIINNSLIDITTTGIKLNSSDNNTLLENIISADYYGVTLFGSNTNSIYENIITTKNYSGILLNSDSNGNLIYHNTFTNNASQNIIQNDNSWKYAFNVYPNSLVMNKGSSFTIDVYVNSGMYSLATFGLDFCYDDTIFTINDYTYHGLIGPPFAVLQAFKHFTNRTSYAIGRIGEVNYVPINGLLVTFNITINRDVPLGSYQIYYDGYMADGTGDVFYEANVPYDNRTLMDRDGNILDGSKNPYGQGSRFLNIHVEETNTKDRVARKGDSDSDGNIDVFDLDALVQSWGATKNPGGNYKECFDFNDDGQIDIFDFDQFVQEWGKKY